ncbi:hypothetical protein ACFWFB_32985 [Streptomyces albidoflavus]
MGDRAHWIPKDRSWANGLEQRLAERREQIARDGLQPDDYPPLPQCPECGAVTEVIRTASDDHPDVFLTGATIVRFEPCRHLFRVDPPSPGL